MTLTATYVAERFAGVLEQAACADADSWPQIYAEFNDLDARVRGQGSRLRYAYTKDMRDPEAEEADRVYREELLVELEKGSSELARYLLASPDRQVVATHYGEQLLRVLEVRQNALEPVNTNLRLRSRQLAKDYDKLVASGEVTVAGETLTLARARGKTTSERPELRKEAWLKWRGWHLDNRHKLAQIYEDLVAVRDEMGRNLGHDDFVPLGYAGMERTDYGPAESQAYRDAVLAHAVPLLAAIRRGQAAELGQSTLKPWDVSYHPGLSLPEGVASPVAEQLTKIQRVFDRLSPRLAAHFRRMRDDGLIDLENRPGKAAGAYCTAFIDQNIVAIFCNSVGNEGDIRTLCHEMGHAFQGWESQGIEATALRWPTMDMAEVHSMGMEFLSLPYMEELFSAEHADRFARARWKKAVELLCYVASVDAFQHWVYSNPSATWSTRDAEWVRLQTLFGPGVDWSGEAEEYRATRWYAQLHIFRYPFYYIDYALAEMGAMQLALLDAADHDKALDTYLHLCRLGGTASMLELLDTAGLRSPFDAGLMRELMSHAGQVLNIL